MLFASIIEYGSISLGKYTFFKRLELSTSTRADDDKDVCKYIQGNKPTKRNIEYGMPPVGNLNITEKTKEYTKSCNKGLNIIHAYPMIDCLYLALISLVVS
ncbi:hypothetical protein A2778_04360 [Candidatus Daviesbacteria bacterium RIFCSPHIGHO2_01_FULL_40_24]|nr:MAG: hypothetical protein A2778_04360 [Candidatus Daviesbacteria bacterium RIFCSPHIGHO2_01_FULL_40_24]OGE43454.1 MAG: hypothetical protein A3A53_02350 [Candidatus Daviesbacteria bacterium RIFCSPLOWO2_01_FULL_39_23]OGE67727.1 MAG: hypothetical protein A3J16_02230 [Candidatus Daviesbacteria bacterium RIFCSPLOWO2_02_FULL_39_13]